MVGVQYEESTSLSVDAVICTDHDVLTRLRPVIRHLCVGLVDLATQVRLISSSPEAESLASLGPVQLFVHEPLVWPLRRIRFQRIVDFLSTRPPSLVYAVAGRTYLLGAALADELEIDLVVQVTSEEDLDLLGGYHARPIAHWIAASEPLHRALGESLGVHSDHRTLIKPGVLRGSQITCFDDSRRVPSVLCTAPLEQRSGIDVILAAVEIIRDRGHQLLVFFPGTGSAETALRKAVHAKKLASIITFANPAAEPIELLRGADILVVAPGDNAVSARPLQAMANGTAVVCFPGGAADYFHDGRTAVVCEDRTARALANGLESLLLDHARARDLAASALEYVKQYHPMSTMAKQTVGVFRRLLLRRRTIPMTP